MSVSIHMYLIYLCLMHVSIIWANLSTCICLSIYSTYLCVRIYLFYMYLLLSICIYLYVYKIKNLMYLWILYCRIFSTFHQMYLSPLVKSFQCFALYFNVTYTYVYFLSICLKWSTLLNISFVCICYMARCTLIYIAICIWQMQ